MTANVAPYGWPMRLDQYDRSAAISQNELTLPRALLAQGGVASIDRRSGWSL